MRFWLVIAIISAFQAKAAITLQADAYHVYPGDRIQEALDRAATNKITKTVVVHTGEYRPDTKRQAMIWFNKRHDGVRLLADGKVVLTAANPQLAQSSDAGYPAVVNHVVYFGDGISTNTVISGFRITGANGFQTRDRTRQMEPDVTILKNWFFYSDGGAIKIFGRSYPQIKNIEVFENFASPCAGGISVQHMGYTEQTVLIENCAFLRNSAQATGCAIDLLAGSAARIVNCLFAGNVSNTGDDPVAQKSGEKPFVNSGVITIFQQSIAEVRNCTFTKNRNGIDDLGGASVYLNNIFYNNTLEGPANKGQTRYDLDLREGVREVAGNFFSGALLDPQKHVSADNNVLKVKSPEFDKRNVPQNPEFKTAGYRPTN
ncbi:MAG TPA: right-handed parallel beta-helix repeat-containing protein [Verrucomicrobiae bacterium]|nr:right-handed parallel beta-helix repeat-containing protein [Verrucomicrobiae bacterium]